MHNILHPFFLAVIKMKNEGSVNLTSYGAILTVYTVKYLWPMASWRHYFLHNKNDEVISDIISITTLHIREIQ